MLGEKPVFKIHEEKGLTRIFVTYPSGAFDHFAFTDDDRDISYRKEYDYTSKSLTYMRPYTYKEKVAMLYIGVTNVGTVLSFFGMIGVLVVGLVGVSIGVWTLSTFDAIYTPIVLIELLLVSALFILQLAGLDPKYPDASVEAPEEEQEVHRFMTKVWIEDDFRTVMGYVTSFC